MGPEVLPGVGDSLGRANVARVRSNRAFLRRAVAILDHPDLRAHLDLTRPGITTLPGCSPTIAATASTTALASERVRGPVLVLHLPADDREPVGLERLAASAVAFSDAIGGGFLDDALEGVADGHSYVVVLDEHRVTKGLPGNQRAAVLAARLGHLNRRWLADLRGDVLIVGLGRGGTDTDVPDGVIDAAARSGLLDE